jgi:hypothetical protein
MTVPKKTAATRFFKLLLCNSISTCGITPARMRRETEI